MQTKKAVFIVVLWAFVATVILAGCGSEEPKSEHSKATASVMAEEFVKNSLKSPSSAKFQWYDENQVEDLGDGKYKVTSYVDSQNSFGAMLRTNYVCTVKYIGNDKWSLEDLQFE